MKAPILASLFAVAASAASAQPARPNNLILFVPDGLRSEIVRPDIAPALSALRSRGVDFRNSHSLFPTFTTANASGMATGHYLGDTGDFSNTIFTGKPIPAAGGSVTPFIESNPVLGDVNLAFDGDYLDEETFLRAAARAGYSTAVVGKVGPTLIFDHTERSGETTIVLDDQTGSNRGIPLGPEFVTALDRTGLTRVTPGRGENGKAGSATAIGTLVANVSQQRHFVDIAIKTILPLFKQRGKPFVLVFWSRDPDGTQHNQGDSSGRLVPGINGPTSLAGIRNADDNLAALRQALEELGLTDTTNIIVAADHGFSTISKESATSPSTRLAYEDAPEGLLPPGFVGLDLAGALGMPMFDPDNRNAPVGPGKRSRFANALIGRDPANPDVVVAANGGSDLIYLPGKDRALLERVVAFLAGQDYTSGLFVDDDLGPVPGTLPLSSIGLKGKSRTPTPSIVVNFRSFTTGCAVPVTCVVEVADTGLWQGQGMHGSFSRGDTHNFMAAIGPDFREGFVDPAPVSNADVGQTAAALLRLDIPRNGTLVGRALVEAFRTGGAPPEITSGLLRSEPGPGGLRTVLRFQQVGEQRYFGAGGYPGRTFGLD